MSKKSTPKFKHDCNDCTFVRHGLDDFGDTMADIYVCNGVVIYRYSSELSDNRALNMVLYLVNGFENKAVTEDNEIMRYYFKKNKDDLNYQ